jgi:hypothetical protein
MDGDRVCVEVDTGFNDGILKLEISKTNNDDTIRCFTFPHPHLTYLRYVPTSSPDMKMPSDLYTTNQ